MANKKTKINYNAIKAAAKKDLDITINLLNAMNAIKAFDVLYVIPEQSSDFWVFVRECKLQLQKLYVDPVGQLSKKPYVTAKIYCGDGTERGGETIHNYFIFKSTVNDNDYEWYPLWEKLTKNTRKALKASKIRVSGHLPYWGIDPFQDNAEWK